MISFPSCSECGQYSQGPFVVMSYGGDERCQVCLDCLKNMLGEV